MTDLEGKRKERENDIERKEKKLKEKKEKKEKRDKKEKKEKKSKNEETNKKAKQVDTKLEEDKVSEPPQKTVENAVVCIDFLTPVR